MTTTIETDTKRIASKRHMIWLDWMKVLATLAVVQVHFFGPDRIYLLLFNLQTFIVVSGLLFKQEQNWQTFWKKMFWNVYLPAVALSLIYHSCLSISEVINHQEQHINYLNFMWGVLTGDTFALGTNWYFYSFVVMKLLLQVLPDKWWWHVLLLLAAAALLIWQNHLGYKTTNAVVCVLMCLPFYLIGILMRPLKQKLDELHGWVYEGALFLLACGLVLVCARWNGCVWMYRGEYGNNFLLFVLGGCSGAAMLFQASKWLGRLPYRSMVAYLSYGTMIPIGLHVLFVQRLRMLPGLTVPESMAWSVMVLLLFVPVIRLAEVLAPWLLGRYRKR